MKSYDDLQRFKEKTQTNHIEFKDMSDQMRHADSPNWAIIRQLMNAGAESALGNGQRIDVAAPQPADARAFSPANVPLKTSPVQAEQPVLSPPPAPRQSLAAFAAAKPAAQPGGSLFDNISALLGPAESALQRPATQPLAADTQPPFSPAQPLAAGTQPPISPAQPLAADTQPPISPAQTLAAGTQTPFSRTQPQSAAVPQTEQARFKQLFSATPAASAGRLPKDTLLQPLLERIASCR